MKEHESSTNAVNATIADDSKRKSEEFDLRLFKELLHEDPYYRILCTINSATRWHE